MQFSSSAGSATATVAEVSAQLAQAIIAATSDATFVKDRRGRYVLVNDAGAALLDHPSAALLGCDDSALQPAPIANRWMAADRRVMSSGTAEVFEETRRVDASEHSYAITVAPWNDADGSPRGVIATARDISASKHVAEVLRESEDRFSQLFDRSPDAILILDPHANPDYWPIIDCNAAACRMNGYAREEMLGQPIDLLNDRPSDQAERDAYLERLRAEGVIYIESVHRTKDGALEIIDTSTSLIQLGGRELILGIDRNISVRKRLEEALRVSETRFNLVARATNDVIWDWDLVTHQIWWNEAFEQQFGYAQAGAAPTADEWAQRIHPEDRESTLALIYDLIGSGGQTWEDEYRFQRADGSYADIWDRGYVLRDEIGRPIRMIGSMLDLTARKLTEAALRRSESRYRSLVDISPDPILLTNSDGEILLANPQAAGLYALAHAEMLVGRCAFEFVVPEDQPGLRAALGKVAEQGSVRAIQYSVWGSGGARVPVELSAAVVNDEADRPIGYLWVQRDITERQKIDRLKNEFVATVSHELRTPLTSIRGALGLIAGGVVGEVAAPVKTMIDIAHNNSERLVRLINDILDMEKIESGNMAFDSHPYSLATLIEQSIAASCGYAEQFGVLYSFQPSLTTALVNVDADRLIQVLTNLLSNAAKFSPPGAAVEIALAQHEQMLRVTVRDYGPGVPAEFHARIFGKFAQADFSNGRAKGGTGLGLSISKAIIEHHGGQIGYSDAPGGGTIFYFDLPECHEAAL